MFLYSPLSLFPVQSSPNIALQSPSMAFTEEVGCQEGPAPSHLNPKSSRAAKLSSGLQMNKSLVGLEISVLKHKFHHESYCSHKLCCSQAYSHSVVPSFINDAPQTSLHGLKQNYVLQLYSQKSPIAFLCHISLLQPS